MKVGGSLGCSDREMTEIPILREEKKANKRVTALAYRTADFGLLKDLLGRIPQEVVVERRADQESWLILRDHLLLA